MDIKNLTTLKTILEEGSFQKAASKLGYTQSTVTFQMQQLEQEFGLQLFEKIGRKMMLTKVGEAILPYVDEVTEGMDKIRRYGKDSFDFDGTLNLAVGETLLSYKMLPVLEEFRKRMPNAKLILRSMSCFEIRDALMQGNADIGVLYDVGGIDQGLNARQLGSYQLRLVASPQLRWEDRDFITKGRRIPTSFIINEPQCIFRRIFEAYLKEKEITLDHTIELWSIETIKNSVAANLGVSYLPEFTVEKELADGTLDELSTDIPDRTITALCAYHKNKWVSPAMELILELLEDFI